MLKKRCGALQGIVMMLCAWGCFVPVSFAESLTPLGPKSDRVYPVSYDKVWQSLIENLAVDAQIMKLVKKDSGIIYFERDLSPDLVWRYVTISRLDKATAKWEKFRVKINLFVQPVSPEATQVVVNAQIRGWVAANVYRFTVLKSNGAVEEEYLNMIQYALSEPAVVSSSSPKG